jgi:hypothetical protein
MNGVDESFQEKQAAPEDISGRREELQRLLEDCLAKATAKRKPEVENVQRMVVEAMLKADEGKMMEWKAEAERRVAEESGLEAEARNAKCKAGAAELEAEAAEREAEAARVVMLEAATELEKAAASEVRRAACKAAKVARAQAKKARKAATKAANRAAQVWCT